MAQLFQVGIKALIRNKKSEILMVKIPAKSGNKAHWDLPGGRMDPGENFQDTLKRELLEELSCSYEGTPKHLMSFLTNITIPLDGIRIPLIFVVFEAKLPNNAKIKLDPESMEEEYTWFSKDQAANEMKYKFSKDFCELVSKH